MPVDITTTILLVLAAFGAGMLDAIVGGGGLIQIPALLLALPHAAPAAVLGTNKLVGACGTSVSAVTYARRFPPTARFLAPMAGSALLGSMLGAISASFLPASVFKPVVLIVLAGVWVFTFRRKDFGEIDRHHPHGRRAAVVALGGGFVIGFYDGLIGPGTGAFLIILLIGGIGSSFLRASATAKVVNVVTNVSALVVFAIGGHVYWQLGLFMIAGNVAGSLFGSRLALRKGSRFVRIVFLILVPALIIRVAVDVL